MLKVKRKGGKYILSQKLIGDQWYKLFLERSVEKIPDK
jgi:hypothetical protein